MLRKEKVNRKGITKELVQKEFGEDEEMYLLAKKIFKSENSVSTAMLQRELQISYFRARYILDKMIEEGFCEPQIGAKPCRRILHEHIH